MSAQYGPMPDLVFLFVDGLKRVYSGRHVISKWVHVEPSWWAD
jgi:hypothetical protein